jgi:hypothetical protein
MRGVLKIFIPIFSHPDMAGTKQGLNLKIRNSNIEINGYPDTRLSGSGYQNIRILGLTIFCPLTFPDNLIPDILHPDFRVP